MFLSELTGVLNSLAAPNKAGAVTAQGSSGELALGNLTWSGTAAPTGITKSYIWVQTGNNVILYWVIRATGPGVLVTSVSTPLPAGSPVPWTFASQANNSWSYLGSGAILPGLTSLANAGASSGLFKDSDGSFSLRINTGTAALAATYALGVVTYLTAF